MKSFNWQDLLTHHAVFSSLNEDEISQLLTSEASQEWSYLQDSIILQEGDPGDSLFVIGSGSVRVTAFGTLLAALGTGEMFGEIAVLERKPRSATVTAGEHCLLLEIEGEEFRRLLEKYPDMYARVRAKADARLQQSNQQQ